MFIFYKAKRDNNTQILTLATKIKVIEEDINRFESIRINNPSLRWDIFKQDMEHERSRSNN